MTQGYNSHYKGHHSWLQTEGHQVSLSALKRYGLRTQKTFSAHDAARREIMACKLAEVRASTEAAVAMMNVAGDDISAVHRAANLTTKMRLQEAIDKEGLPARELGMLTRALSDNTRDFMLLGELVKAAGKSSKDGDSDAATRKARGVTPEVIRAIRHIVVRGLPKELTADPERARTEHFSGIAETDKKNG